MQRIWTYFSRSSSLFFASAALFAIPFHLPEAWVCTFLGALVLCLAALRQKKETGLRRLTALGFGFGFFYHLCLYHWLLALHPFTAAGIVGLPSLLLAVFAYVGASAVHGLYAALGFLLWGVLRRASSRRGADLLFFLVSFLLFEGLTSVGTLAMPWSRIGLPLAATPVLVQPAAVLGPWGVDLVILLFGACAALFWKTAGRRRLFCGALALLLAAGYPLFGFLLQSKKETAEETLRVSVCQTVYASDEKWVTSSEEILSDVRALALAAAKENPDVIVFPESVLASASVRGDSNEAFFASLSEECDAAIVAGAVFREGEDTYNAICLYDAAGLVSFNAKRHLVPFGEYLPWQDVLRVILPAVADMAYYRSGYTTGESGIVGDWMDVTFGGMVCFDSLFTELSRESVGEGAEILFVVTNDSWFKNSPAAREHLWQSVYRAVETSRSLAQSANTGISALVLPTGEIIDTVSLSEPGVASGDLSLSTARTLYSVTGDLVLPACLAAALCGVLLSLCRAWKKRRRAR